MAVVRRRPRGEPLWHGSMLFGAGLMFLAGFVGVAGMVAWRGKPTAFPKPREGATLFQSGVYAWVRHPLYASLILLGIGWALFRCSSGALVAAAALTVFLDAKARREERWLRERFDGYVAYAQRVRRFIPRIY